MKSSVSSRDPSVRAWWCEKLTTGVRSPMSAQMSRTCSRDPNTSCCPVTSIPSLGFRPTSFHQSTMPPRFA